MPRPLRLGLALGLLLTLGGALSCGGGEPQPPNVLWVVWDTVRADHMGLYGYGKPTTPHLEAWARGGRVYDDCLSSGGSTIPAHGGMFTGIWPSEHGASNAWRWLDGRFETAAEIFRAAGYRTYLWSANPNVSEICNMNQGFDVAEHPWDPRFQQRAAELVQAKLDPRDRSSELPEKYRTGMLRAWDVKASGSLAGEALDAWLESGSRGRPYFAFVNYMEAHRPLVPAPRFREAMMSPEQVARSFEVERDWDAMWSYVFGLAEYSDEDLEIMAATYDAAIAELDEIFAEFLERLEQGGWLENTIVVVTSDHGEHLGEHHLLDHQYSLYDDLLRVPLILHYPPAVTPGRSDRPVSTLDVLPTLVELCGIEPPGSARWRGSSLLGEEPAGDGARIAEMLGPPTGPTKSVRELYPDWNPGPWTRQLRSIHVDGRKLIWSSDGEHEEYDLAATPREAQNLYAPDAPASARALELLEAALAGIEPYTPPPGGRPRVSDEEERARLESLGYTDGDE